MLMNIHINMSMLKIQFKVHLPLTAYILIIPDCSRLVIGVNTEKS